jgi:hypothetical protein
MTQTLTAGVKNTFKRLKPCEVKVSCTVSRGAGGSNAVRLLDFSFVARQKRLAIGGENFYIDLVFYNYLLNCFVLIDLKIGKITHQDIGQMQMYVNYYTRELMNEGENKPIGIVLGAEKNQAVVEYTLPEGNSQIFAAKYKLYLPTEEEFKKELNLSKYKEIEE